MKKNNLIIICLMGLMATGLTSCLKKIEIPATNLVAVTFNLSGDKFVTQNMTVNPKDSLLFDFTIKSPVKDMKYVYVQRNGTDITKDTVPDAAKSSYSSVKRFVADSSAGVYTYSIVAKDAEGIFVGSASVIVTVTSEFDFYTFRTLQVPDTTGKTNKCYFSTKNGLVYSYTDGASNSALIDFGYFYDTTRVLAGSPAVLTPKGHTIYALNANVPFTPYDLSSWTKNATLLKLSTTVTFASLISSGHLRTAGLAALGSGTVTRISTTDRATASQASHLTGSVILFKTVNGKYGAIAVNFTNHNAANKDSYISIDVKVQK